MRRLLFLSLLYSFFLLLSGAVSSQTTKSFDPMTDDISNNIPILEALIDSALANNPMVQYRDLQIILINGKLKASRYEWTRNVGIQADVRYGNYYNYTANTTGGIDPPASATSRLETKFGGAVFLNMPIHTLVSRKNQINMAKTEIEQARSMSEVQRDETRKMVIMQYNDLILKQRLLRIKSRNLETARINMQMVEKQFSNGVVPVTEYSRITEIISRAEADFEGARMDFLTAYMVLEEIIGIKFNLTQQISGSDDGN